MKRFRVNKEYEIVCDTEKTRNGFKHTAKLKQTTFYNTVSETKKCYLNRTWESFEYETVIKKLLSFNTDIIPKRTQTRFLNKISGVSKKAVRDNFRMIAGIMAMGDILTDNQKEANDWKARMLRAGLEKSGLIMPEDWNTLTEEEKTRRLNNVQKELSHAD